MNSKNSIFIVTIVLFCMANHGVFAQTKPKTTKEVKKVKEVDKKVVIISKPYSGDHFVTDIHDGEKKKTENSLNQIYVAPEVRAEYPGGLVAFYKFFYDHYNSPPEQEIKLKAFVSFVVEVDGSLSDIKLVRDPGYGNGKEILKVIKTSPKWKPAVQNGKAVRSIYTLPIGR